MVKVFGWLPKIRKKNKQTKKKRKFSGSRSPGIPSEDETEAVEMGAVQSKVESVAETSVRSSISCPAPGDYDSSFEHCSTSLCDASCSYCDQSFSDAPHTSIPGLVALFESHTNNTGDKENTSPRDFEPRYYSQRDVSKATSVTDSFTQPQRKRSSILDNFSENVALKEQLQASREQNLRSQEKLWRLELEKEHLKKKSEKEDKKEEKKGTKKLKKERDSLQSEVKKLEKELTLTKFEIQILKSPKKNLVSVGLQTTALSACTSTTQTELGKSLDSCHRCSNSSLGLSNSSKVIRKKGSEARGVTDLNEYLKNEVEFLRNRFESERRQNETNEVEFASLIQEKNEEILHYKELARREKATGDERSEWFSRCEDEHRRVIQGLREELKSLNEKHADLKNATNACNEQLESLENGGSNDDILELKMRITELGEENREITLQKEQLRKELCKMVEKVNDFKEKSEILEKQKGSLEKEIDTLKEYRNPADGEESGISKLKSQKGQLTDKIMELEIQKNSLEDQLQEISEYRMGEMEFLQKNLDETRKNLRIAEKSRKIMEKERCDLKEELVEMQLLLSGNSNEVVGKLKEEINELKKRLEDSSSGDSPEKNTAQTDYKIERLEGEKKCLEGQLKRMRNEGTNEITILRTQLKISDGKLDKACKAKLHLESERKTLQDKLKKLEAQLKEVLESQKRSQPKDLDESNSSLLSELENELTQRVEAEVKMTEEMYELRNEISSLHDEKKRLTRQLENVISELQKLKQHRCEKKVKLAEPVRRTVGIQVIGIPKITMTLLENGSQTDISNPAFGRELRREVSEVSIQTNTSSDSELKMTNSLHALRKENATMMETVDRIMSKYHSLQGEKLKLETQVEEIMKGKTKLRNVLTREFDSHGKSRKAYRTKIVTLNLKIKKLLGDLEKERRNSRASLDTAHEFERRYNEIENERMDLAAKLESHLIIKNERLCSIAEDQENDILKSNSAPVSPRVPSQATAPVLPREIVGLEPEISQSEPDHSRTRLPDSLSKVLKELNSSQQLNQQYESDLAQAIERIQEIQTEVKVSKTEIDSLKAKLESGDHEWVVVNFVQEQRTAVNDQGDLETELGDLELTLKRTKSDLVKVNTEFNHTCVELLKTHEKLGSKMDELELLEEKLDESESEKQKYVDEIKILKQNLDHARSELEKRDEAINSCISDSQMRFDQQSEKLILVQTDADHSRSEADCTKKVLDHVTEELQKAKQLNDQKLLEERKYLAEFEKLRWELHEFQAKEENYLTEIRQLTQRSNSAHCALSNALEKTNRDLLLANQSLIEERECTVRVKNANTLLQEEIENLKVSEKNKAEIGQMAKKENQQLQKIISQKDGTIKDLEDELRRMDQECEAEKLGRVKDRRSYETEKGTRFKLVDEVETLRASLESASQKRAEDETRIMELNSVIEKLSSTASEESHKIQNSRQAAEKMRKVLLTAQEELDTERLNSKDKITTLKRELKQTKIDRDTKIGVIQELSEKLQNHEKVLREHSDFEKQRKILEEKMTNERKTCNLLKERSEKIWKLLKKESDEKQKAVHRIKVLESQILQYRNDAKNAVTQRSSSRVHSRSGSGNTRPVDRRSSRTSVKSLHYSTPDLNNSNLSRDIANRTITLEQSTIDWNEREPGSYSSADSGTVYLTP